MKLYFLTAIPIICLVLAIATTVQAESYWYFKAGIGKNMMLFSGNDWQDNGELGCSGGFGHRHHLKGNFYGDAGYMHYSQCMTGPPWNDDYEDSLDAVYYYIEVRW